MNIRLATCFSLLALFCAAFSELPVRAAPIIVSGSGYQIASLSYGGQLFANRSYVWTGIAASIRGWQFTRLYGGETAAIQVLSNQSCTLYVATASDQPNLTGWQRVDSLTFCHTDRNHTLMYVYARPYVAGTTVPVPQQSWTGTIVLMPELDDPENTRPVPGVVVD